MSTIDKGALALDRNIAAHINPFIGFNSEETLDRCADTVDELGYVISAASNNCHEMSMDSLFRIFETISFALRYEQEQLSKSKEASHG